MNQYLKTGVSALAAGVAVSIGGIAYLSTGHAWLFPIGLFMVCLYKLDLFTGKICYYPEKSLLEYAGIYTLNTISAYLTGLVVYAAKPVLAEKAEQLVQAKLAEGPRLIPLAILCNVLIFVAVDSYRRAGSFLGLIFSTTVFVACGFEHCIANAFYFGAGRELSLQMLMFLFVNVVWNGIGGILAYRISCITKGPATE